MKQGRQTHQQRRQLDGSGVRRSAAREWIGGRVLAPAFVTEGEPHRVEMIVWLEQPDDFIVGMDVLDPKSPLSIADSLQRAMKRPAVGSPRCPARVRIEDAALAAELRRALPELDVVAAPTPELAALVMELFSSMSTRHRSREDDEAESYFENGRVSLATVEKLFHAAAALYRLKPWTVACESQVLRCDIPALGVEGACLSIIGELGESLGVLIFPSLAGYRALERYAEAPGRGPIDFGTTILALNFEAAADLPRSMRREAAKHGWPVADTFAFPRVEHRDRDGVQRPLTDRDVQLAAACAAALASFFARHRQSFESEVPRRVSESYTDDAGLTARITVPYEAFEAFEPGQASSEPYQRPAPKVSRNAPCPCGSGLKYKKCCQARDASKGAASGVAAVHALDERLVTEILRFGERHCNDAWALAAEDFDDVDATRQLFIQWLAYCFLFEGRTLVERYLDEHRQRLSANQRSWLEAQKHSWLSVWEVLDVEPGQRVRLKDLLSEEERSVREVSGSRVLKKRDAVLARVVDHDGESVFCGIHPHPLQPAETAEVVRRVRARLRRKSAVPVERLRAEPIGRYMIARWEDAVYELDLQHVAPMSQRAPGPSSSARDLPIPAAEADEIVRAYKARHYQLWLDIPLPALDGMTPREAAKKKAGRERVDLLLKEIESHESRLPGGPQVDFSHVRAQLGLD